MNKKGYISIYAILITLFIFGCESEPKEIVPDISNIELTYDVIRYEQLMKNLDTTNLASEVDMLRAKYPNFSELYFSRVLPFVGETDEDFYANLRGYLGDERIVKLQDTVAIVHKEFQEKELIELETAMKYLKHYIDDFEAPNIYTFISEYTFQKFIFEDVERDGIGIGLDMFLGAKYDYKSIDPNNPAFSQYLTRSFSKEHIAKMMIEILINDKLGNSPGSRLIDHMIHNGKQLFILDKVMPGVPDSILLEYTGEQTEWVENNELEMWAFFFDEELFYESNPIKIGKYINPSPNSPGMPSTAPGRTANYIGWQIVKAYMKRYPETTIKDLIRLKDSQMLMDKSRFKPKQK